jgi:hypothetical protein
MQSDCARLQATFIASELLADVLGLCMLFLLSSSFAFDVAELLFLILCSFLVEKSDTTLPCNTSFRNNLLAQFQDESTLRKPVVYFAESKHTFISSMHIAFARLFVVSYFIY